MFHKVKFGAAEAFEMAYDMATSKKVANSIWLAERHGVKQMTGWLFRRKVQEAMKSSEKHPLKKEVHVDEKRHQIVYGIHGMSITMDAASGASPSMLARIKEENQKSFFLKKM